MGGLNDELFTDVKLFFTNMSLSESAKPCGFLRCLPTDLPSVALGELAGAVNADCMKIDSADVLSVFHLCFSRISLRHRHQAQAGSALPLLRVCTAE